MSVVRIYKSTDPGAPPHPSSTRGSMAALLRACLVTGYGSGADLKEPAGWEEPFVETNNYACFRALQGTARQFYQINDATTDADVTLMTSYDSMSDAESGINSRGQVYFGKWINAGTSQIWSVFADEKTCYVVLDGQNIVVVHGFGEYQSFVEGDPCPAFISGHSNAAIMDTNGNLPLHVVRHIGETASLPGYLARCITSGSASSFSMLAMAQAETAGIPDAQFSGPHNGVSFVCLPIMVQATIDQLNGTLIPCGVLRGGYQILADTSGQLTASDGRKFETIRHEGPGVGGRITFLTDGSWD